MTTREEKKMNYILEKFKNDLEDDVYICSRKGEIHFFTHRWEGNGTTKDGIHFAIESVMKEHKVTNAKFICFGNNLYGKEINWIWEHYPNVQIELMVCSPEVDAINEFDRDRLRKKIKQAIQHCNTTVYASDIVPTWRVCMLYNEKQIPVLCCYQNYVYSNNDATPSVIGRHNPCLILYKSDDEQSNELLIAYVELCQREFERLQEESCKPYLSNNGKVCCDYNE